MSGLEAMLSAMEGLIGTHETNGNNTNKITQWYGMNGQPWCDMTITYAAHHSGNADPVCFGGKFAYTVAHAQAFKNHGQWHPMDHGIEKSGIRRGDIIFFDWSGGSSIAGIDHVGIVTGVSGDVVHTIEGNIDNRCGRYDRKVHDIAGFGRPAYSSTTPSKPNNPPSPPLNHGKYEPFPGTDFFKDGKKSPIIAAMHVRLVAVGCNRYETNLDKDTWGAGDKASYAAWQRKLGYSGKDADGIPGKASWDALHVPNV